MRTSCRRVETWTELTTPCASAGIASIIRVPFTDAYMKPVDILYHSGHIVLWTIVECGLGIIAGSLPMLRRFLKRFAQDESTQERGQKCSDSTDLLTIGRVQGRHGPVYDTDLRVTAVGGADSDGQDNQDGDNESTRHIIKVTRDVRQTESDESLGGKGRTVVHPSTSIE